MSSTNHRARTDGGRKWNSQYHFHQSSHPVAGLINRPRHFNESVRSFEYSKARSESETTPALQKSPPRLLITEKHFSEDREYSNRERSLYTLLNKCLIKKTERRCRLAWIAQSSIEDRSDSIENTGLLYPRRKGRKTSIKDKGLSFNKTYLPIYAP